MAEKTIHKNGCHKGKFAEYSGKYVVHSVQYFIPQHDFSLDPRYAELCEPLDYRDIEFAKRYSVGGVTQNQALHEIQPNLSPHSVQTIRCRIAAKAGWKALVDYLKRLAVDYKFAGDLDKDTLTTMLEEDIWAEGPGSKRSQLVHKLLDLRGEGKDKGKKKRDEPPTSDPTSPDKWDEALKTIDEEIERGPDDED